MCRCKVTWYEPRPLVDKFSVEGVLAACARPRPPQRQASVVVDELCLECHAACCSPSSVVAGGESLEVRLVIRQHGYRLRAEENRYTRAS